MLPSFLSTVPYMIYPLLPKKGSPLSSLNSQVAQSWFKSSLIKKALTRRTNFPLYSSFRILEASLSLIIPHPKYLSSSKCHYINPTLTPFSLQQHSHSFSLSSLPPATTPHLPPPPPSSPTGTPPAPLTTPPPTRATSSGAPAASATSRRPGTVKPLSGSALLYSPKGRSAALVSRFAVLRTCGIVFQAPLFLLLLPIFVPLITGLLPMEVGSVILLISILFFLLKLLRRSRFGRLGIWLSNTEGTMLFFLFAIASYSAFSFLNACTSFTFY